MTFDFWLGPRNWSGAHNMFTLLRQTGGTYGVALEEAVAGVSQYVAYRYYGVGAIQVDTTPIPLTGWTHVSIVVDKTTKQASDKMDISFYINGQLSSTWERDRYVGSNPGGLYIFQNYNEYWGSQFYGLIDELRLSDIARPPDAFPPDPDVDDHTKGLWHFDESTGAILHDSSLYNNDGVVEGTDGIGNDFWVSGMAGYGNAGAGYNNSKRGMVTVNQGDTATNPNSLQILADLTIDFWMQTPTVSTGGVILRKGGTYGVEYGGTTGPLSFRQWGAGWEYLVDDYVFAPGQWYHVTIVADKTSSGNQTTSFYIDSKLSSTHVSGISSSPNTNALTIFNWDDLAAHQFYGKLDELRIRDIQAPPLSINWIKKVGNDVQIEFNSLATKTYGVFAAASPDGDWDKVLEVFGQAGSTIATIVDGMDSGNVQFYLVGEIETPEYPLFTNVTSDVGLNTPAVWNGPSWGDYNNDDYPDLYCFSLGALGVVWRNNAGASFSAVQGSMSGANGVWGDYDNDGDPDLFTWDQQGSAPYPRSLYRNDGGGTPFTDRSADLLDSVITSSSIMDAHWGDWDKDGDIDIYLATEASVDYILRNNGSPNWTFNIQALSISRNSRGVEAADYDGDHDPDIYVGSYNLQANQLLQNNGSGVFSDVAGTLSVAGAAHTTSPNWGDFNNDGEIDLFMGNFAHPGNPESEFFENSSGAFTSRGNAGFGWQECYHAASFADYNNDGTLDLFFTARDYIAPDLDRNVLYSNGGNWNFTKVDAAMLEFTGWWPNSWADYDGDGDLDLMTIRIFFFSVEM